MSERCVVYWWIDNDDQLGERPETYVNAIWVDTREQARTMERLGNGHSAYHREDDARGYMAEVWKHIVAMADENEKLKGVPTCE